MMKMMATISTVILSNELRADRDQWNVFLGAEREDAASPFVCGLGQLGPVEGATGGSPTKPSPVGSDGDLCPGAAAR
jgi:hypothetical protein